MSCQLSAWCATNITNTAQQWTWKLFCLWPHELLWMLSWPHSLGLLTVFSPSLPLFSLCFLNLLSFCHTHLCCHQSQPLHTFLPLSLLSFLHLPCLLPLPVFSLLPPFLFPAMVSIRWPLRAINLWSAPPLLNPVWRGSLQADKYHQQQKVGLRPWCSLFIHYFNFI